jgi:hypothetical protein
MRRLVTVGAVALVFTGLAGAATGPSLRLVSLKPFAVGGRHFKAHERVIVTLTVQRTRTVRRATATATGTFRVSFGDVALGRCGSYTVRAAGLKGSVAILKRPPLPACIPARAP